MALPRPLAANYAGAMNGLRIWLLLGLCAPVAWAGTLAQIRTVYGTLEVELYDHEKPATVANFKKLAQAGAWQNSFFHRLVPGFVLQGGGFVGYSPQATNELAPPWYGLGAAISFGSVTNEYAVGPRLSNTNGTLAMAKVGSDPDSASNQWFINLGNNAANLDNQNGGFTVFGRVIHDPDGVLPFLNTLRPGYGQVNMGYWYPGDSVATGLFSELPVTYAGNVPPRHRDLLYFDVSFLSVQVSAANHQPLISWNSVAGRANVIEFTTNFPPIWRTLVSTNGNGQRLAVADPAATNGFRFYRARVLY